MVEIVIDEQYLRFIVDLKENIRSSRTRALLKVNEELIKLYYNIGKKITLKQKDSNWGDNLIGQIERDLKKEFPDLKGFSKRNIIYMKNLYQFIGEDEKMQQLVAQIPWGHIILILTKIKNKNEAMFYIQETINNLWSRIILEHQIELNLYSRKGNIKNNFKETLNQEQCDLVLNSFKENYILDFLDLKTNFKERELENALISNISNFLLELGKGFAFVGRQKKFIVGGEEFFVHLLFYNYNLKRFVVVEIKTISFKPEHLGQLSFYLNVIDTDFKTHEDKETIGLLICKSKNEVVVEYALKNNKNPLGIAHYKLSKLPFEIEKYFPSQNELKEVLK